MERRVIRLGSIALLYCVADDGNVTLSAVPAGTESRVDWSAVEYTCWPYRKAEPIIQAAVLGDPYPRSYQNGQTLRNASGRTLRLVSQTADESRVVTVLEGEGRRAEHTVRRVTDDVLCFSVTFENRSDRPLTLERLDSFSLSAVAPYTAEHRAGDVCLVRVRSHWSEEGVVERIDPYDIDFQPSWSHFGAKAERFGGIGSMSNVSYAPLSGVEDVKEGVSYALLTEACGSWQTEFYRESDPIGWGSGQADFYFGHWQKTLAPGETFSTCAAYFTCCRGTFDDCCRRLVRMQETEFPVSRPSERTLPIIFNEYGTTWGNPSQARIAGLVQAVKALGGVEYFVIDAGWFKPEDRSWEFIGDWKPSRALYPDGFEKTIETIRAAGLRPGIWFEWEGVSSGSAAWERHKERLLTRQGQTIMAADRGFWNFERADVREFFRTEVVGQLKAWNIGYLKTDYNENIGIGCDGAESLGEGLRRQMVAVRSCYEELRALPDLVSEICSSGGMRTEPGFMRLADMISYSDTHECDEGGIVAANVLRWLHAAKAQIWAVIREDDTPERMAHTLSKAFMGRMCLSGDVDRLNAAQTAVLKAAIAFYRRVAPVIAHGDSYIEQEGLRDFRHLDGAFSVVRVGDNGEKLVVINAYRRTCHTVTHPALTGRIAATFGCGRETFALGDGKLTVTGLAPERGGVAALIV